MRSRPSLLLFALLPLRSHLHATPPRYASQWVCMSGWMCLLSSLLLWRSIAPRREDVAEDVGRRLLREDLETLKTAVTERVLWQHSRDGAADDLGLGVCAG